MSKTYENILTRQEGRVGIVQINRPRAMNALNSPTMLDITDALQAFDQALKLKPNDPALTTYKGIVYYAMGNNAKAMQLFDEAIRLNPNFARAYYQKGMVYQSQEKYKQAVPELVKAKQLGYGVDPDFINLMKKRAAEKE